MPTTNKNVLIINTGGTIGMRASDRGFVVEKGFLEKQLRSMPEFHSPDMPRFEIFNFDPVVDSALMTPSHWQQIANVIADHEQEFDAFVILHGTDSMAYTASALAFMLQGLTKTVVLTGSQIPLCLTRNDARDNLITAMSIAGQFVIPEVCIFFGDHLLRGCRATKGSVYDFNAFKSPNDLPIGEAGTQIRIFKERIRAPNPGGLQLCKIDSVRMGTFRIFPGIAADVLDNLLSQPLQALVLETYGVGTAPSNDDQLLQVLKNATDAGIAVIAVSQCEHGTVSPRDYAAGSALADAGVISGSDMTIEAAIAKLYYLFSMKLTIEEIRAKIGSSIVGELTPTQTP